MGDLEAIVAIFLVVAIGSVVAVLAALMAYGRKQTLQRIAQRFSGRVEWDSPLRLPQVRLRLADHPAVLRYISVGEDKTHTQIAVTCSDLKLRCEIYPQNIFSGIRKLRGMEDIEIGFPKFDAAYFIAGNDKAAVCRLLTTRVQHVVNQLAEISSDNLFGSRNIQVKWSGGVLAVTKPSSLVEYALLEKFVSLTSELCFESLAMRSEGIEFIRTAVEPDAAQSQCQICGEPLVTDLVQCASCRTPHHRECWEYFGGCSTYACGQKKYVVAASA